MTAKERRRAAARMTPPAFLVPETHKQARLFSGPSATAISFIPFLRDVDDEISHQ
jgi:hypothetical protein